MGKIADMVDYPEEILALMKLTIITWKLRKQIPSEPHWRFSYSMLQKVSRSFILVIQLLGPELRNVVCIFYLVLRALDTVEDDTSILMDVKMPLLRSFHRHMYDREWHFSCGTKEDKVLMDKFHFVSTSFLELCESYQAAIDDITKRMGAGMAKFLCKEVETVEDYNEYCHYVSGLVGLGLSQLFHASGKEELASDALSNSMGLFLQKANIIRDYLEDINEKPKSRMFWPRQIWSKYADNLEDFKYDRNSVRAVQCLNDMVTDAFIHAEDCLLYMSALKDFAIFRFCAIPQITAIATLALCYNNLEVFSGVKLRHGLVATIIDQTRTMSDVYGAFYEFSSILKSKINESDPNAALTHKRIDAIQKVCISSGKLNKTGRSVYRSQARSSSMMIMILVAILAIIVALFFKK